MEIKSDYNLDVSQRSKKLMVPVYQKIDRFPSHERIDLCDQNWR